MTNMICISEMILTQRVLVGNCLMDAVYIKREYQAPEWGGYSSSNTTEETLFMQNNVLLGAVAGDEPVGWEEVIPPVSNMEVGRFTPEDSQQMLEAVDQTAWEFTHFWERDA